MLLYFKHDWLIFELLNPSEHVLQHTHRILVGSKLQKIIVGNVIEMEGHIDGETFNYLLDKMSGY